jgi:hypothetical protein
LHLCTNDSCTQSISYSSKTSIPFDNKGAHSITYKAFASKNGYLDSDFVSVTYNLLGDINKGGGLEIGDIIFLIKYLFSDSAINPLEVADVNRNMKVDTFDLIALLKRVFG